MLADLSDIQQRNFPASTLSFQLGMVAVMVTRYIGTYIQVDIDIEREEMVGYKYIYRERDGGVDLYFF